MSDLDKQEQNAKAVPFFARYLEGQVEDLSDEEMEAINSGRRGVTGKRKDEVTTLKYPSDQEDGVTKKYPSDSDEVAVTMKYPSDGDDDPIVLK